MNSEISEEDIKNFLIENKELIKQNNLEELYHKFYFKFKSTSPLNLFLESHGINILNYMKIIPSFYKYDNLDEKISIPEHITKIGKYAFSNMIYLESIIILNKCKTIGNNAFSGCINLKHIELPEDIKLEESVFRECFSLLSIKIPKINKIPDRTFFNCRRLREVAIPNSVTEIEGCAFTNCGSLSEISLPNNIIQIGEFAFSGCDMLKDVVIPDSVEIIEYRAFSNCHRLISLKISNNIKNINSNFADGSPIESIKYKGKLFTNIDDFLKYANTNGVIVTP